MPPEKARTKAAQAGTEPAPMVGALRRLNREAVAQVGVFRTFLTELREHLEGTRVLGTLMPQLADHMLREELYFTEKLMTLD